MNRPLWREDSNSSPRPTGDGSSASAAALEDASRGIPLLRFLGVRMVAPSAPDVDVSMEMDRTDDMLNLVGNPHGGGPTPGGLVALGRRRSRAR